LKNYAYADGINYYLQNPAVQPVLLQHFEPWYPLLWTDGIGAISMGDLNTGELKAFYSGNTDKVSYIEREKISKLDRTVCFGTFKTASGNAILYQSSHKLLFQMRYKSAEEGLNAYGAVTWGNFFFYRVLTSGWMHTSSSVDVSDMYAEK
jgi:hypothetical protein